MARGSLNLVQPYYQRKLRGIFIFLFFCHNYAALLQITCHAAIILAEIERSVKST